MREGTENGSGSWGGVSNAWHKRDGPHRNGRPGEPVSGRVTRVDLRQLESSEKVHEHPHASLNCGLVSLVRNKAWEARGALHLKSQSGGDILAFHTERFLFGGGPCGVG